MGGVRINSHPNNQSEGGFAPERLISSLGVRSEPGAGQILGNGNGNGASPRAGSTELAQTGAECVPERGRLPYGIPRQNGKIAKS